MDGSCADPRKSPSQSVARITHTPPGMDAPLSAGLIRPRSIIYPSLIPTGVKRMSMNYSGQWRRILASLALVLLGTTAAMAQFTPMTPLSDQSNFAMQAYLNGKLYVFGGSGKSTITRQGQSLDVTTPGAAWTPTATLNTGRIGGYAAAINGKIYLMGGYYTYIQNQQQYTTLNDTVL